MGGHRGGTFVRLRLAGRPWTPLSVAGVAPSQPGHCLIVSRHSFRRVSYVTAVRLNLITCSARKLPTARSLKSRGRCSAQSRAEGRAPRAISYRGAGKVRRRIRRLVPSRFFNNARTATRNLDLPLAIGDPHPRPSSSYCIGGFWPVHGGHNGRLFFGIRRRSGGFFNWAAIFGQARTWISTDSNEPRCIRKPLDSLDDWRRKTGFEPPRH